MTLTRLENLLLIFKLEDRLKAESRGMNVNARKQGNDRNQHQRNRAIPRKEPMPQPKHLDSAEAPEVAAQAHPAIRNCR